MKTEKIQITDIFDVNSSDVYSAWLDSKKHEDFTGGGPANISENAGSNFTAWNGYISGKILELEKGKRIFHSWRTTDFPENAEDSFLEILLEDTKKGCKLTLKQWNIPEGQGKDYEKGWQDFYFKPMKEYFTKV